MKVVQGGYDDLPAFYSLYAETAERDRFIPRPLPYFQRMWTALTAEDPDRMRLYLAHHEGEVLAAATMLTVGEHVWYSYGASTSRKREVQPNNAIQWRMLTDAHALGAERLRPAGHHRHPGGDRTTCSACSASRSARAARRRNTSASGTSRSTACCTRRWTSTWRAADVQPAPRFRGQHPGFPQLFTAAVCCAAR